MARSLARPEHRGQTLIHSFMYYRCKLNTTLHTGHLGTNDTNYEAALYSREECSLTSKETKAHMKKVTWSNRIENWIYGE